MTKKSLAFTLAEVLLTMTIIGVVAAMTIPTLHYQKVKKEYTTKLKNFYSKMENAVMDMESDYGSFRDLKRPKASDNKDGYDWYMKYIDPYVGHKYVKTTGGYRVYYSDGSMLTTFYPGGCLDVIYDVNGDKRPNHEGYDRFRFLFCFNDGNLDANGDCNMDNPGSGRCYWFANKDIFFGTYGGSVNSATSTRDDQVAKCQESASYCTKLLETDQWEFKNDYPYKF